jgi:RecB family exonuclease
VDKAHPAMDCGKLDEAESVFEKVDSHRIGVVIHGVSESPMRDECRCPAASAAPIRAT